MRYRALNIPCLEIEAKTSVVEVLVEPSAQAVTIT